jgi:BioD-like phosphotransacetylase family protein
MSNSKIKVKSEIQKTLNENIVFAGGDFCANQIDEDSFISDVKKNFKLTPIDTDESVQELLKRVIKSSTSKVRGMINERELKQSKFFKELFKSFEIEML